VKRKIKIKVKMKVKSTIDDLDTMLILILFSFKNYLGPLFALFLVFGTVKENP